MEFILGAVLVGLAVLGIRKYFGEKFRDTPACQSCEECEYAKKCRELRERKV